MTLDKERVITWSDYRREDEERTFGLLSQVSPDGRYVVSTVKDRSVFVATDDLAFSQLFFPIKGILVYYDRRTKDFRPLPGADDRRFVQSNPTWSPDGKYIVFARSEAYRLKNLDDENRVLLTQGECEEFLNGGKLFLFDLYRIPFNEGKGGTPEPLEGASNNGMSNYFPKFSPDGKWIVFCKAKSFMLLQPDSELYIMPAEGGDVRRMRCNTPRMNSWHSWSPNGKWMVFSSKAHSVYTQLFLTHIDEQGRSSPAILLSQFTSPDRAANIPEFVNTKPGPINRIRAQFVDDDSYLRAASRFHDASDFDGAVQAHRKALEFNPNNAAVHRALGIALTMKGMLEEARAHLVKSIQLEPDVADTHSDLAVVLRRQGKFQEAIEPCRTALRIDPQNGIAQLTLGIVLFELGKLEEARVHLSEAVRLRPNDPVAHYYLAVTSHEQEEPVEAAVHYGLALEHNPDYVEALVGLASIRVTASSPQLRNAEEAVELATRACQLTRYEHPVALDILGTACAQAGRFSDAVAATERALRIARATKDEDFAKAIQERLELYKQHKPAHRSDSP
jgi:Flp pilus assembly protein TadD